MDRKLRVMRPVLPSANKLHPYLTRIDDVGLYSNFGPLHANLTDRFAEYFNVDSQQVALIANGTLGLQAAVETVGEIGDTWVLPAWTFVASGQAVLAAGRRIHFADVERDTWELSPRDHHFARGHLVVAPFGSKPNLPAWSEIMGPKIFDAAAGFDACRGIGADIRDESMIMVSLHATKTLPAAEGAVLIGPADWIKRASQWANFGFAGSRFSSGPGMNAKMSEYHAAVGLASLDSWNDDRVAWERSRKLAVEIAQSLNLEVQPSFAQGFVTSTWNVHLPSSVGLTAVTQGLADEGIETRSWWPACVSDMSAFRMQTAEPLPNAEQLVDRVLGLPFSQCMESDDFQRIAVALEQSLAT